MESLQQFPWIAQWVDKTHDRLQKSLSGADVTACGIDKFRNLLFYLED